MGIHYFFLLKNIDCGSGHLTSTQYICFEQNKENVTTFHPKIDSHSILHRPVSILYI